ncbi:hypothetical protein B0H13DRAFT_2675549 [Mycena leptocephala]|nr:hypothetical protein B0H13DRAFT_2675549 [Mycena leptocephala]
MCVCQARGALQCLGVISLLSSEGVTVVVSAALCGVRRDERAAVRVYLFSRTCIDVDVVLGQRVMGGLGLDVDVEWCREVESPTSRKAPVLANRIPSPCVRVASSTRVLSSGFPVPLFAQYQGRSLAALFTDVDRSDAELRRRRRARESFEARGMTRNVLRRAACAWAHNPSRASARILLARMTLRGADIAAPLHSPTRRGYSALSALDLTSVS